MVVSKTSTPHQTVQRVGTESADEVISKDGTRIAFSQWGHGSSPLVLVDGALGHRSFGPMPKLAPLLACDFTVVAYDRRGRGDSGDTAPYSVERELDDLEAVIDAVGGSACVVGVSSGAALALEAANRLSSVEKLGVYEAPFIVDGSRPPLTNEWLAELDRLVAADRRGDAVKLFMKFVGTPSLFVAVMRWTPVWSKLRAVAHTLPYDLAHQGGHGHW